MRQNQYTTTAGVVYNFTDHSRWSWMQCGWRRGVYAWSLDSPAGSAAPSRERAHGRSFEIYCFRAAQQFHTLQTQSQASYLRTPLFCFQCLARGASTTTAAHPFARRLEGCASVREHWPTVIWTIAQWLVSTAVERFMSSNTTANIKAVSRATGERERDNCM